MKEFSQKFQYESKKIFFSLSFFSSIQALQ